MMEATMLTPTDFQNLLALISSPQLTINGAQAQVVSVLQFKLQEAIKQATEINKAASGIDAGSAEQSSDRAS
jgi:hypothetical protein